jgi:glutamine amidotransferase-like uncharacterized protein
MFMKNYLSFTFIVLVLISSSALSAFAGPKALVYNGAGACKDDCAKAAFDSAVQAGFDAVYVGDQETDPTIFNGASVWLQPGGYAGVAMNNMAPALKKNLKNFIYNGGGYVGFCAGAFVATSRVGTTRVQGLGIISGSTKLYGKGIRMFKTLWQGSERYLYWEGGPYFRNMPDTVEQTGAYPNGANAAVRTTYGKGRVWVTGLHPESPQWWKDESGYADVDGDDRDLVTRMLHWVTEAH